MKLQPIGARILVEPIAPEQKGLIVIPDSVEKDKPQHCKVMALGTGERAERLDKLPLFDVKVGDEIIIAKYGGSEVKVDGVTFKLVNADDIMAIVQH